MNPMARLAVAAIAVVAVFGGAVYVLAPPPPTVPPVTTAPASPTPSASAAPSAAASASSAAIDTTGWVAYTSPRYGFVIAHPKDWTERPSDHDWTMDADRLNYLTSAADGFMSPDYEIYVSAFSVPIPAGTSNEAWLAAYQAPDVIQTESTSPNYQPCEESYSDSPGIVDGRPATIRVNDCGEPHAFVFVGDRAYVVAVWLSPTRDARKTPGSELLAAFISTVHLPPAASGAGG